MKRSDEHLIWMNISILFFIIANFWIQWFWLGLATFRLIAVICTWRQEWLATPRKIQIDENTTQYQNYTIQEIVDDVVNTVTSHVVKLYHCTKREEQAS